MDQFILFSGVSGYGRWRQVHWGSNMGQFIRYYAVGKYSL